MKPLLENTLVNKNHPEILYWFWDEHSIVDKKYMRELEKIKESSPFDLIFLTARGTLNFFDDREVLSEAFAEALEYAHNNDLKIALQLWRHEENLDKNNALSLIVEEELTLNSYGEAHYIAVKRGDREYVGIGSELFGAFVFDKVGAGEYKDGSFEEVTTRCAVTEINAETLDISVSLGEAYANKTIYFLTSHYCKSPDLYSDYYIDSFSKILSFYQDIPFDGIGLDEFKSMNIKHAVLIFSTGKKFRERLYGKSFAEYYKQESGCDLKQTILEMRYVKEGDDSTRIYAINSYFDVLKDNVIRIENFVAKRAKELYGEDIFIGLHNTYHNYLGQDEIWQTGCMWWDLPREYGQTDEHISYPVRLGIACSYPKTIVYDMYYAHKTADEIYVKAMEDAKYSCRIHYHAFNDTRPNRFNMDDDDFLEKITKVENKIRLLNHIDTKLPAMDLLVVFGRPAMTNWFPHEENRDDFDMNISTRVLEKANLLWNNNIVCAVVPSTKIDSGVLKLAEDGSICYNGHSFKQLLFIGAQYSKKKTLEFLLECSKHNTTFIDDIATHDFDGNDCSEIFAQIGEHAHVIDFSVRTLCSLGVAKNKLPTSSVLTDGMVICSDTTSVLSDKPEKFSLVIGNHTFTGEYIGIMALKADPISGEIQTLACGGFHKIYRDGTLVMQSKERCDLIYNPDQNQCICISDNDQNKIEW